MRNARCVTRFKEFQGQFGIQNHRIEFVAGGDVATSFQELILRIHCFGSPFRILATSDERCKLENALEALNLLRGRRS